MELFAPFLLLRSSVRPPPTPVFPQQLLQRCLPPPGRRRRPGARRFLRGRIAVAAAARAICQRAMVAPAKTLTDPSP